MPTQSTTYNSRITDEALEKRFRDAFRSQGGAELVDDLYASGVIVPVVDFTAAAEGSALRSDLQSAWDFATDFSSVQNTTSTLISNSGFWRVQCSVSLRDTSGTTGIGYISLTDGLTSKKIYQWSELGQTGADFTHGGNVDFEVFLRSGDSLTATSSTVDVILNLSYRQIADLSGNLNNPTGFTSS